MKTGVPAVAPHAELHVIVITPPAMESVAVFDGFVGDVAE
jgi:hypothetical protein